MKTTMSSGSRGMSLRQPLCGIAAVLMLALAMTSPASAARQVAQTTAKVAAAAPVADLSKLSADLRPLVTSPGTAPADAAWAKSSNGQVLVKVLIVGTGTDAELASLRADVLARGGSVFYNYVSVRALSAMLPTSALGAVAGSRSRSGPGAIAAPGQLVQR